MESPILTSSHALPISLERLSVREVFAGRHILIAGASGFLGKVWLSMVIDRLPEIGRIYVLMRRRSDQSPQERFEQMVSSSFVFAPLHEKHGPQLGRYLSKRVEVIEGDVSKPHLGLSPEVSRRLRKNLDLFLNCAGLVDFNPDSAKPCL